jgi:hypothetical protein
MAGTPIAIWSFLAVAAFDSADHGSIHTTDLGRVCRRRADESRLSRCLESIGYSYMQGRRDQNPSGGWHRFTSRIFSYLSRSDEAPSRSSEQRCSLGLGRATSYSSRVISPKSDATKDPSRVNYLPQSDCRHIHGEPGSHGKQFRNRNVSVKGQCKLLPVSVGQMEKRSRKLRREHEAASCTD